MFTGIIEDIGILTGVQKQKQGQGLALTVQLSHIYPDDKLGDSMSVDGVCLTVESIQGSCFKATASEETLKLTNFRDFRVGTKVNLERAAKLGDRLGGHLVSGHVETTAILQDIMQQTVASIFVFQLQDDLMRYVIHKGSIAVSGISLTVNTVDDTQKIFTVAIIPHTMKNTTLSSLKKGSIVNVETDVVAKYIEKLVSWKDNKKEETTKITESYLQEHGFI